VKIPGEIVEISVVVRFNIGIVVVSFSCVILNLVCSERGIKNGSLLQITLNGIRKVLVLSAKPLAVVIVYALVPLGSNICPAT